MILDFDKIVQLKKIRMEKSHLSEKEAALSKPTMHDRSMITKLYELFKEALIERDCPSRNDSVTQRKKFIFIVLYLYAPSALAGGKMSDGLRSLIANVVGVQSKTSISNDVSDIIFQYEHYSDFKNDVNYIFEKIKMDIYSISK